MTDSEVKKKVEPSLEAIVAVGRAGARGEGGQRRRSEAVRSAATGFGLDDAWWPPSGRRPEGPEASDSRVRAGFDGVGNSWNRRASRSGDGAVEPPGARAVRAAAAEIRRENQPRSALFKAADPPGWGGALAAASARRARAKAGTREGCPEGSDAHL